MLISYRQLSPYAPYKTLIIGKEIISFKIENNC